MPTYNISINDELDKKVKEDMKKGYYANRSEYFRDVLRNKFLGEQDYVIEQVPEDDPDYALVQERKKDATFISFEELKAELNISD